MAFHKSIKAWSSTAKKHDAPSQHITPTSLFSRTHSHLRLCITSSPPTWTPDPTLESLQHEFMSRPARLHSLTGNAQEKKAEEPLSKHSDRHWGQTQTSCTTNCTCLSNHLLANEPLTSKSFSKIRIDFAFHGGEFVDMCIRTKFVTKSMKSDQTMFSLTSSHYIIPPTRTPDWTLQSQ
jgi:hypothetical protein